ncbi:MAG: imidazole glycerol phosphate synthase subunit HisH [Gemmatimonadetes bacterium]|nr:imidazole glycerol phosphate synthase subunit HisH [Gemmatimonadota bacterium]
MRRPRIAVVNHQAANIHSVAKALEKTGADVPVTVDAKELARADGAVLPGVGASDAAMRALGRLGLVEPLKEFARSGRPLLCVCLGMQLLFPHSDEGRLPGLGLLEGNVRRFSDDMPGGAGGGRLKVPHMGWNSVTLAGEEGTRHPVFEGIGQGEHFYFVHSYYCVPSDAGAVAATARYGVEFCAAVAWGAVIGTQFHPEKSGALGLRVYEAFARYVAGLSGR